MSFWKRFAINMAITFFTALKNESETVRKTARPVAKELFDAIRLAYMGDPDFE